MKVHRGGEEYIELANIVLDEINAMQSLYNLMQPTKKDQMTGSSNNYTGATEAGIDEKPQEECKDECSTEGNN